MSVEKSRRHSSITRPLPNASFVGNQIFWITLSGVVHDELSEELAVIPDH